MPRAKSCEGAWSFPRAGLVLCDLPPNHADDHSGVDKSGDRRTWPKTSADFEEN